MFAKERLDVVPGFDKGDQIVRKARLWHRRQGGLVEYRPGEGLEAAATQLRTFAETFLGLGGKISDRNACHGQLGSTALTSQMIARNQFKGQADGGYDRSGCVRDPLSPEIDSRGHWVRYGVPCA